MKNIKLHNFKLNFFSLKSSYKFIFWATTSVFMASYILLTLQTVASGAKFAILEKEEENINNRNRELSTLIMQSTSLIELEQKSDALGFSKPEKTVYIGKNENVADLPF